MSPRKQIALKRKTVRKRSMKAKIAKMVAARHSQKNPTNDDANNQSSTSPQAQLTQTSPTQTQPPSSPTQTQPPSSPQSLSPPHTPSSATTTTMVDPTMSASARKLHLFSPSHKIKHSTLPTTITSFDTFASILSGLLCRECYGNRLVLKGDPSKDRGLAIFLSVVCEDCDTVCSSAFTSSKLTPQSFEVNKRIVASSLATGVNYSGLSKFCEFMNMPTISQRTHHSHMEKVEEEMSAEVLSMLKESADKVRTFHDNRGDVLEVAVSFDGSWPKRGHTSKLGIGVVIEVKTGLALDFHVMSTYCQQCSSTGEKMKKEKPQEFEEWAKEHEPACTKNFEGSAGAMEVEAAKVLWSRSEALHNMRYTTLVSDGDTKTFLALQKLSPYGDVVVEKQECVNHVAKRLNTALRNLVSTESKKGVRLGGSSKGSLTQVKIGLLQSYYTKAVRTYNSSVEVMSNAIWAAYYHSISTDSSPQHMLCPNGQDSWCFYQKALSEGREPAAHSDRKNSTFLNERVAGFVKPIYTRLTDPVLLKRCLLGTTQNANESLHSSIWSKCPKHLFGGLRRVRIAVALGVAEFNGGANASHRLMAATGCPVTAESVEKGKGRDRKRLEKSALAMESSTKVRRQARLAAKKRELEALESQEGGSSYISGGF